MKRLTQYREECKMASEHVNLYINSERLLSRLKELGEIGRDRHDRLTRLAASDEDKAGRDLLVTWMKKQA